MEKLVADFNILQEAKDAQVDGYESRIAKKDKQIKDTIFQELQKRKDIESEIAVLKTDIIKLNRELVWEREVADRVDPEKIELGYIDSS